MKTVIKTLCIAIFSFFLFLQMACAEETFPAETTVGISQLMNNADQYTDSIMIQGIVSKVFPQDRLIGLIDNPNTQGCGVKKCTGPCDKAASKKCPMKAENDPARTCPIAASANPVKDCTKTCPMASSKECPIKAATDSGKSCPMATDQIAKQDAEKKCPMASAPESGKTCPMAAGKECAKSCSMASSKECPKKESGADCPKSGSKKCTTADAKTCGSSGVPLMLPVLWDGDMPEPSSDVRVVGKISNKDGRLLFVAESIKVMSN